MKNGLFEVGDIIKGVKGNRYWITGQKMKKAEVITANEKTMLIKILEHEEKIERNGEHYVENNKDRFKLFDESQEDFWKNLEVL